jgi:hypothetical protein
MNSVTRHIRPASPIYCSSTIVCSSSKRRPGVQYIQLPSPDEPAHGVLSTKHHGPFESPSQAVDGQPDCVVVQPVSVVVHELLHVHASHIEQPVQYGELHVHLLHHDSQKVLVSKQLGAPDTPPQASQSLMPHV